jgi:hypothetical protein
MLDLNRMLDIPVIMFGTAATVMIMPIAAQTIASRTENPAAVPLRTIHYTLPIHLFGISAPIPLAKFSGGDA